jgi:hypothetical protein
MNHLQTVVVGVLNAIDKAWGPILLLIAGLWVNQNLEAFKAGLRATEQAERDKSELQKQLEITRRDMDFKFRERQLTQFYWPIYLRLQKDSAIWQHIGQLARDQSRVLPDEASRILEKAHLLENHGEIVKLIEANIQLSGNDEALLQDLTLYIGHVAVYKALRDAQSTLNPIDVGAEFPAKLIPRLKERLDLLQREYTALTAWEQRTTEVRLKEK